MTESDKARTSSGPKQDDAPPELSKPTREECIEKVRQLMAEILADPTTLLPAKKSAQPEPVRKPRPGRTTK